MKIKRFNWVKEFMFQKKKVFIISTLLLVIFTFFGVGCEGGKQSPFGTESNIDNEENQNLENNHLVISQLSIFANNTSKQTTISIGSTSIFTTWLVSETNDNPQPVNVDCTIKDQSQFIMNSFVNSNSIEMKWDKLGVFTLSCSRGDYSDDLIIFVTDPNGSVFVKDFKLNLEDEFGVIEELNLNQDELSHQLVAVIRDQQGNFISQVSASWNKSNNHIEFINVDSKSKIVKGNTVGSGVLTINFGSFNKLISYNISKPIFNYTGVWSHVHAEGPNQDAFGNLIDSNGSVVTSIVDAGAKLKLKWNSGYFKNYNTLEIHRNITDQFNDLSTKIASQVINGDGVIEMPINETNKTYFYKLIPSLNGIPDYNFVSHSIQVVLPPANITFISRSTLNLEACRQLPSKYWSSIDSEMFNRCSYDGPGNNNGYLDFKNDFLVNKFEMGCDISVDGVTYDKNNGLCKYFGVVFSALSMDTKKLIASHSPLLPPLVQVTQNDAFTLCESKSIDAPINGQMTQLTMKLPNVQEWRGFANWGHEISESDINRLESGLTFGSCNTSYRNNVMSSNTFDITGIYIPLIRTGSTQGSQNCKSMYGLQDMVGNVQEWVSDQCVFSGDLECKKSNSGFIHSSLENLKISNNFDYYFSSYLGVPIKEPDLGLTNGDQAVTYLNSDKITLSYGQRGLVLGGGYADRNGAGRWATKFDLAPWAKTVGVGFRCAAEVP